VPGRARAAEQPDRAGRSRQLPVARPGAIRHPGRTRGLRRARGPGQTPGLAPGRRVSGRPALCRRDRWHQDRSYRDRSHLDRWYRAVGKPARDHVWRRAGAACEGHGPRPARGRGAHGCPDQSADRWRDAVAGQPSRVAGPTRAAARTASRTTRPAPRAAADRRPGLAGTRAAGPFPAQNQIVAADAPRIPPARQGRARQPVGQCHDRYAAPCVGRCGDRAPATEGRSADRSPTPSADRYGNQSAARPADPCAAPFADQYGDRPPAAGGRSAGLSPVPSADQYGGQSAAPSVDRCADQCAAPSAGPCAAPSAGQNRGHAPAAGDRSAGRSPASSADRCGGQSAAPSAGPCAAPSAGQNRGHGPAAKGRPTGRSAAPSADRCADQCAARPEDHHGDRCAAPSAGRCGDHAPAAGDRPTDPAEGR
jgi:hypothetical protein